LSDPASYATGGYEDDDGTIVLPLNGTMGQIDGATENWPGFSKQLTAIWPDWDDTTDTLETFLDIASMPNVSTVHKAGMFAGVGTLAAASRASATFAGMGIYPNALTTINVAQANTTALSTGFLSGSNSLMPVGLFSRVDFTDSDGSMRIVGQAYRYDGSFAGTPNLIAASIAGTTTVSNRHLWLGGIRVSAVATACVVAGRLWVRRTRRDEWAKLSAGAKVPSPRNVIVAGHSIANGVSVGGDATYGGAAVPAGVTLIDNGSVAANYPNNAGTGPDPSVLPYWANNMGTGKLFRRSASGAILSQFETQFLPDVMLDLQANTVKPSAVDAVVMMIGENDAQTGVESAAYTTRLVQVMEILERAFPNARLLLQDMRSEDAGGYSEFPAIRAANAAAVALNPRTRRLVPYTGISLSDTVHYDYTATGYARAGALQWEAYQAAG
jgi:lysophospholipase L1-like esterase